MEKMTRFRLGVAAAALTGCAFGAVALGPVLAGAQESGDDTTTTVPSEDGATDETAAREDCGPGGRHPALRAGFEAAAEAIGIEPSALRDALQDGQTIAEVAEANGVDPADVIAAMVADAQERIAQAVTDGHITQEEADERLADLEQRMTDIVNGEIELRPGGPGRGHRFGGPFGERPADEGTEDGTEDGTS